MTMIVMIFFNSSAKIPYAQGPVMAKVTPGDCTLTNNQSSYNVTQAHSRPAKGATRSGRLTFHRHAFPKVGFRAGINAVNQGQVVGIKGNNVLGKFKRRIAIQSNKTFGGTAAVFTLLYKHNTNHKGVVSHHQQQGIVPMGRPTRTKIIPPFGEMAILSGPSTSSRLRDSYCIVNTCWTGSNAQT